MTRSIRIGAVLWIASNQYYFFQIIAAATWNTPAGFSWTHNTISDLGNTACGPYGDRLVCSPWHAAMNVSFVLLGLMMIAGAYLFGRFARQTIAARIGFGCMMLAGLGTILVGFFPENSTGILHIAGATLALTAGNIGMVLVGAFFPAIPKWLRLYSIFSGGIALLALVLFTATTYLGIGIGGMERIAAYPQSLWMIVFGSYFLTIRHVRQGLRK